MDLNVEYELPFYLRAIGCTDNIPPVRFPEGNSRHYLAIITKGQCKLKFNTKMYLLQKGDGFFIRSHFSFQYEGFQGACGVHWIVFDGYAATPIFSKFNYENYMIFHNLDIDALSIQVSNMYLTSLNENKTSKFKNSAAVYQLLVDIYEQSEQGHADAERKYNNDSFLRGKRCIEQYFYKNTLTQKEIADAAGITTQYLCRLFQANLHQTPMQYLNHVRIERAKYLLRTSDDIIQVIGEKVGFSTPHYFSSTFRKLTGSTPSLYRKLHRIATNT